jgi:hypothetical protein
MCVADTLTIFCHRCSRDVAIVGEPRPKGPRPDPTQGGGGWRRLPSPARPPGTLEITGNVRAEPPDARSTTWRYRLACGGRRGHRTEERVFTEATLWAAYDRRGRDGRASLAEIRRAARS